MIDPDRRFLVTGSQLSILKDRTIQAKVQCSEVSTFEDVLNILNAILREQELQEETDLPGKVMYAYQLKEE